MHITNMCNGSMTICYRNKHVQLVWMIIFAHIHSKFEKKYSVEFFSPAFAKCQTSKILPTIVNCFNLIDNTVLTFMCYRDIIAKQCVSISFIQQQSHCSGHSQKWPKSGPEAEKRPAKRSNSHLPENQIYPELTHDMGDL